MVGVGGEWRIRARDGGSGRGGENESKGWREWEGRMRARDGRSGRGVENKSKGWREWEGRGE